MKSSPLLLLPADHDAELPVVEQPVTVGVESAEGHVHLHDVDDLGSFFLFIFTWAEVRLGHTELNS